MRAIKIDTACLALLLLIASVLSCLLFPFLNLDINRYLNIVIRLREHRDALDGVISPLLAWCVYVITLCDCSLITSLRIVQIGSLASVLLSTLILSRRMQLQSYLRVAALVLTTALFLPYALSEATGDTVAAAVFSWLLVLLTQPTTFTNNRSAFGIGTIGALAYFGKAMLLPIVFLCIAVSAIYNLANGTGTKRSTLMRVLFSYCICILFIAPYLYLFHSKYGVWDIGLNLYFDLGLFKMENYTIEYPVRETIRAWLDTKLTTAPLERSFLEANVSHLWELLWGIPSKINSSYTNLLPELEIRFGGYSFFALFLCTAFFGSICSRKTEKHKGVPLLGIILFTYIVLYSVWGGRLRYYLPIIGASFAMSMYGLQELSQRAYLRLSVAASLILPLFVVSYLTISQRYESQRDLYGPRMLSAQQIPDLKGAITGNVHDVSLRIIAAALEKEIPAWIIPDRNESAQTIAEKLAAWRIGLLIWHGNPLPAFDQIASLHLIRHVSANSDMILFYDASALWRDDGAPTSATK